MSRQPSLDPLGLHATGQRNSLIEYVCWTSKAKRLARTLIESKSNPIQVRLREAGQIGAFREALVQKAVRVFVRSSLPRAPGVAEVSLNICRDRRPILILPAGRGDLVFSRAGPGDRIDCRLLVVRRLCHAHSRV